jgi:hypothetical protein
MAENKTTATKGSVSAFLRKVPVKQMRDDCIILCDIMKSVARSEPVMWGSAIVGFGSYHFAYESGREGDMPVIAFSPRKSAIVLYLKGGLPLIADELALLGKHDTGKGCVYIKALTDVKLPVLKKIIGKSWKEGTKQAKR